MIIINIITYYFRTSRTVKTKRVIKCENIVFSFLTKCFQRTVQFIK